MRGRAHPSLGGLVSPLPLQVGVVLMGGGAFDELRHFLGRRACNAGVLICNGSVLQAERAAYLLIGL